MLTRLLQRIRINLVAYLALFVALGGTSYAALSLPANSVGSRQLRNGAVTSNKVANGSITPVKLNNGTIGGSVRHWAVVTFNNNEPTVIGSSSHATVRRFGVGVVVSWGKPFPGHCAAIATIRETGFEGIPPRGFATAGVEGAGGTAFVTSLDPSNTSLEPFTVAVLC